MKRTFYHGTSADNLPTILKHGISCSETKLWSCSHDAIYLWDDEKCNEEWEQEDSGFRMATESGQLACIVSKDCRVVVLKIELDETEVEPDRSCPNMEGKGAVCIYRDIKPSEISEIRVSNDLSLIRGYFMALMEQNEYNAIEFSRIELRIIEAFKKIEIYPEDIDDMIEWENVEIAQYQTA